MSNSSIVYSTSDNENISIKFDYENIDDFSDLFVVLFECFMTGEAFMSIFNNILNSGKIDDAEIFLSKYKQMLSDVKTKETQTNAIKKSQIPLIKPSQFF